MLGVSLSVLALCIFPTLAFAEASAETGQPTEIAPAAATLTGTVTGVEALSEVSFQFWADPTGAPVAPPRNATNASNSDAQPLSTHDSQRNGE